VVGTCRGCDAPLEGLAKQARWCSESCRKRTERAGQQAALRATWEAMAGSGPMASATRVYLERTGVWESSRGQCAWLLARWMDVPELPARQLVACSRELRALMREMDTRSVR
jgi:hypothetical protein